MTSRTTLRRRLHHGDVDGKKHEHVDAGRADSLNEPLLGDDRYGRSFSELIKARLPSSKYGDSSHEDFWDDERRKEHLHWAHIFSQLVAQWAQWFASLVLGSGSLVARLLHYPFGSQNGNDSESIPLYLSPLQEERLRNLQQRLEIPFDGSCLDHQDALRQLWRLAYPSRELPSLKSELWKEMGWQGTDPSTDFRGGGFISLENLIFFAKKYPESFQRLLHKEEGKRAEWEYPFAVAGINISFMLTQMLDLQTGRPSTVAGVQFVKLLAEDEMAFDHLYCIAFQMMDAQWLAKRASYMEFNEVLKSTRMQLERELALEDVHRIEDLPAYTLLRS
ncbi:ELMO domain-containing protein A isoform X1 [Amborella trichopoda]|uniref:ELMO domain-containing protein A isoform X1 n=1 Tax=Amborella trichopoda TaxID=13333 RepID=UPI0005D2DFBF|nr:ELMO domain-containing protein A isoform X1 [Amborella trichopoda]XP_011620681.1 ELMO domain-containing protein A isoform X1 [Amborella trichopoda]|eukprot:XP_011620680.1 ELMO domain-containing protein A isoform X1 [Amborella trichopoda]